jgi:hydrogenase nickel incorporation protein HypA/HybF
VHELSFAESTLELALRHARAAGAQRIVALHLVVGEFTALEPASLQFYWERITRDTPADGSRVDVRRIPAQLACLDCGAACDPREETWSCRSCGSPRLKMTSGDECYLESIDVEGAAPSSPDLALGVPSSGSPAGYAARCEAPPGSDETRSSPGCVAR